jgi:hypothetical protein
MGQRTRAREKKDHTAVLSDGILATIYPLTKIEPCPRTWMLVAGHRGYALTAAKPITLVAETPSRKHSLNEAGAVAWENHWVTNKIAPTSLCFPLYTQQTNITERWILRD